MLRCELHNRCICKTKIVLHDTNTGIRREVGERLVEKHMKEVHYHLEALENLHYS